MHIVLSGTCPLVKLRLQNNELSLGYSAQCSAAHNSTTLEQCTIHFHNHTPHTSAASDLQWTSLRLTEACKGIVLESLELQCSHTRIELESFELAAEFRLSITGDDNVLQIWHLNGMRLSLEAGGHRNSVSFTEPQAPLQEVRLQLTGWDNRIQDLWLLGCSFSSISVANCSVVVAALEPDTQERCFEFNRDENSQILVYLPNEHNTRQVLSNHELWSFDSTLISIFTHPKSRPLTRPPSTAVQQLESECHEQRIICGICRTAAPDHLLQPCGHLFFCGDCFNKCPEQKTKCPICRGTIQAVQRIFPIVSC